MKHINTTYKIPPPRLNGWSWLVNDSPKRSDRYLHADGSMSYGGALDAYTNGPRIWEIGELGGPTYRATGYIRRKPKK